MFQSPSRDSGGLKLLSPDRHNHHETVSIPQSGFWWVEAQIATENIADGAMFQSPSRDSGGLKAQARNRRRMVQGSFNPPVGILVG